MWRWWNFLEHQVPAGKRLLRLNLDETAVRFYYKPRKGLVASLGRPHRARRRVPLQQASRAMQRKALSHMAIVCDDSALQPLLPQVLIGNEHVLRAGDLARLRALVPRNVLIWRCKSAWANQATMRAVFRLLAAALAPHPDVQPVLLMDALSVHTSETVIREASRLGIWTCVIPAKCTWLLQPLDTDAFATYKQYLRARYVELVSEDAQGELVTEAVVACIGEVCRRVLQGHVWRNVFLKNGFGREQAGVRQSILEALQWMHVPHVAPRLPTLRELQHCFRRGADIPIAALFAVCAGRPPAAAHAASPGEAAPAPEVEPWARRLRPRVRRDAPAGEAGDPVPSAAASSGAAPTAHAVIPRAGPPPEAGGDSWQSGGRMLRMAPLPPARPPEP